MESFTQSELESFLKSEMDSRAESEIYTLEGVIFDPTDEESIRLLEHKACTPDFDYPPICQAEIYKFEPYDLPGLQAIQSDGTLYFFCRLIPLDASGERYSRGTKTGYWKKTGNPVKIMAKRTHEEIGERRTLVFYERFSGGSEVRTNWKMYEYSAKANNNNPDCKDLVVCRIREEKEKEKKEVKKRCISTKNENEPAKKRLNSTNDGLQPEPQLPPSCYLISDPRSDAVGNANPEWHYYSVSNVNNHAVGDTSLVDPLPLENLNVLNGSTRLYQTSFFTQSTILPEQGTSSSSVFINGNELLNSSYGNEREGEDYLQEWLLVALDEFLNEEPDTPEDFVGDISDVGTEIFNTWVDEAFWNNTLEHV